MRMNVCLVRASQFFPQFCLMVYYKPRKEHIIPDALSRLASTNYVGQDNLYFELDAFFIYHASLVNISPNLVRHIIDGYLVNNW